MPAWLGAGAGPLLSCRLAASQILTAEKGTQEFTEVCCRGHLRCAQALHLHHHSPYLLTPSLWELGYVCSPGTESGRGILLIS